MAEKLIEFLGGVFLLLMFITWLVVLVVVIVAGIQFIFG